MVEADQPGGTTAFYSVISSPTEVAKNVLYITNTLIADTFVSYRLFTVWNRAWWILFVPIVLLVATASAYAFSLLAIAQI